MRQVFFILDVEREDLLASNVSYKLHVTLRYVFISTFIARYKFCDFNIRHNLSTKIEQPGT